MSIEQINVINFYFYYVFHLNDLSIFICHFFLFRTNYKHLLASCELPWKYSAKPYLSHLSLPFELI